MDFSDPVTHSTHKKTKAALFISWLLDRRKYENELQS